MFLNWRGFYQAPDNLTSTTKPTMKLDFIGGSLLTALSFLKKPIGMAWKRSSQERSGGCWTVTVTGAAGPAAKSSSFPPEGKSLTCFEVTASLSEPDATKVPTTGRPLGKGKPKTKKNGEKPGGAQGIFLAHAQRSLLEGLEGEPHGVLRIELGQLHARQTALPTVLPLQLMSCCYSRKWTEKWGHSYSVPTHK